VLVLVDQVHVTIGRIEGGNNYGVWNVKFCQLLRHGRLWVLDCPNDPMVVRIAFRRIIAIAILIVISPWGGIENLAT
jgi:hypothetical protein